MSSACCDRKAALLARRHLETINHSKKLVEEGGYAFIGYKLAVPGDCFVYVNIITQHTYSSASDKAAEQYKEIR